MSRYDKPVEVDIVVETPNLERGAFYNICFITENDSAPRTLEVSRLSDLLDNGYGRLDLAYNFCVGVFAQQGINKVYVRAKRVGESYIDSYKADSNEAFYYLVIQSKKMTDILDFNSYLDENSETKLQFYSQKKVAEGRGSLVSYFQEYRPPEGGVTEGSDEFYLNKSYLGVESSNNQSKITILGLIEVGATLKPKITDLDGVPTKGVSYSWMVEGVEVSTEKSYRIKNIDFGKTLSVKANFIDELGSRENVTSPSSELVTRTTLPDYLLDNRSTTSIVYAIQKLQEKLQG